MVGEAVGLAVGLPVVGEGVSAARIGLSIRLFAKRLAYMRWLTRLGSVDMAIDDGANSGLVPHEFMFNLDPTPV